MWNGELTEFVAELTEFAAKLSVFFLLSETVRVRQYSTRFLHRLGSLDIYIYIYNLIRWATCRLQKVKKQRER